MNSLLEKAVNSVGGFITSLNSVSTNQPKAVCENCVRSVAPPLKFKARFEFVGRALRRAMVS